MQPFGSVQSQGKRGGRLLSKFAISSALTLKLFLSIQCRINIIHSVVRDTSSQNFSTVLPNLKGSCHNQVGFSPGMQGMIQHPRFNQCDINRMKDKNHITISTDAEKAFDKMRHPLIKTSQESGYKKRECTST